MSRATEFISLGATDLAEIIRQAPIGICVVAYPSLQILIASNKCHHLLKHKDPQELLITTLADDIEHQLARHLLPLWRQVAESGKPLSASDVQINDQGTIRFFEFRLAPLKSPGGQITAILTTL